jgi:hypothetical protein
MNPILIDIKKRFYPITSRGIIAAGKINLNNNEMAFDEEIAIEDDEQPPPNNATRKIRINEPVNCNGLIEKIKLNFFTAIEHYWDDLTSPDMLLPSLLDPRMKDLSFVTNSECEATKNLLREKYEELKSQDQNNNFNLSSSSSTNISESKGKKVFTVFANLKKRVSPADDEVGLYLQSEEINLEANPFMWWYERKEKFPVLNLLAKKYLAVYACSTASERLFSDAGNLLTAKRTRMSPRLFKELMFLKRNGKHLDSIFES